MMKTLEKSLMADGTSSDMLLLKVLTARKRVFLLFAAYYLLKSSDNKLVTHLPHYITSLPGHLFLPRRETLGMKLYCT